jgi:hypothetical protein
MFIFSLRAPTYKKTWKNLWGVWNKVYDYLTKNQIESELNGLFLSVSDGEISEDSTLMAGVCYLLVKKINQYKRSTEFSSYADSDPDHGPDHLRYDGFERWSWILEEIEWALKHSANAKWQEDFMSGEVDIDFQALPSGYFEMITGPSHTFTVDDETIDRYNARIDRGLFLFGIYFRKIFV